MTGSAVLGTVGVGFEPAASPGRQTIFAPATVALTQSATNQPVGTTGVRLLIAISGVAAGASATVSIAGLKTDGVTAVTETTTSITLALADSNNNYFYCTKAVYGSINASGITATAITGSLAGATIAVYGIVAAKYLVPAKAKFEEDFDEHSPDDHRGILDEDIRMIQLIKKVKFDIESALYPESCQYFAPAAVGNVTAPTTPASIPASPTVLKASTSFTSLGASYTLTTQPTNPGMLLSFVISGNSLAGTLTITGTAYGTGAAASEVISVLAASPNGTFYSVNSYASVTNIAITGFTPAALCVTNGVFAYNPIYNPTNSLVSLAAEWYSGTQSDVCPYLVPEDFEISYDVDKELKFTMKGMAQDKIAIGDRTPALLTASNFNTYAQPVDSPIAGWPGLFYVDALSGTPGTTLFGDVINMKISGKTGLVPYWTGVGQQVFNRVGRKKRKTSFEAEIDFVNMQTYTKYQAFTKLNFVAKFLSPYYLGVSTTPQYKYIQFIMSVHLTKFEVDPKDEKVTAKITGVCEYEPSLGYAFQVSFLNQNTPAYAS